MNSINDRSSDRNDKAGSAHAASPNHAPAGPASPSIPALRAAHAINFVEYDGPPVEDTDESVERAWATIIDRETGCADLLAALKAVEWVTHDEAYFLCPRCGAAMGNGHVDWCQLAAVIAKAEGGAS